MTGKELIIAAAFVLVATSATFAQGMTYPGAQYGYGSGYGTPAIGAPGYGVGVYDYAAPPFASAPAMYGNNDQYFRSDGPGRGNDLESQR